MQTRRRRSPGDLGYREPPPSHQKCSVYLAFNLTKHLNVSFSFTKGKLHLPQIGNKYAGIAFQIVVLVLCTEVTLFSFSSPGNTRHVLWEGICQVTDGLRDVKEGVSG